MKITIIIMIKLKTTGHHGHDHAEGDHCGHDHDEDDCHGPDQGQT